MSWESTTIYYRRLDIVEAAKAGGADGVILGVATFDTARLHCAAAVDFMLAG